MSHFLDYPPNEKGEDPDIYAFIQWKGTDACFDFHCECGEHNHFDGYFAYVVKCAKCSQEWEMPCILIPRKRCDSTFSGHNAVLMDGDDT